MPTPTSSPPSTPKASKTPNASTPSSPRTERKKPRKLKDIHRSSSPTPTTPSAPSTPKANKKLPSSSPSSSKADQPPTISPPSTPKVSKTPNASTPSSPRSDRKKPEKLKHRHQSSSLSSSQSSLQKPQSEEVSRSRPTLNSRDVLLLLIASRLLNALVVQTFFQPDEFFQALEPAWAWAFGGNGDLVGNGGDAGAWITWEWKHHLRSAIHPAIFTLGYRATHALAQLLRLSSHYEAELLLASPKTIQAVIAAAGDYYTWKLADQVYGASSLASAAALILTVGSPWQWFCATRTFSNCLEATLTIIALYNWPWHWGVPNDGEGHFQVDDRGMRIRDAESPEQGGTEETTRLRRALLSAAIATILRPTNILIWLCLMWLTFLRRQKVQWFVKIPFTEQRALVEGNTWSLLPSQTEITTFIKEALTCGSATLGSSALIDRLFYNVWTFPPFEFLKFNVLQSIAVFYGNNNWHYYLSQGYPLLLTTALPFAVIGMYQALSTSRDMLKLCATSQTLLKNMTVMSMFVPAVLSVISHKEVRFIYPLLPGLHILAAQPLATFFGPVFEEALPSARQNQMFRRLLLGFLLSVNMIVALVSSTSHNSGLINVTHYLRHEFETYYADGRISPTGISTIPAFGHGPAHATANGNGHAQPQSLGARNMTVAFLTPCHSTPWRSHLQYPPTSTHPGIDAWALTCEPPLNMAALEKAAYVDEADQFYLDPEVWLKRWMSRHPPDPARNGRVSNGRNADNNGNGGGNGRTSGYWNQNNGAGPAVVAGPARGAGGGIPAFNAAPGVFAPRPRRMFEIETGPEDGLWRERGGRRPWPEYLVFFEQLEPQMRRAGLLAKMERGTGYRECKRVWNSWGHEDWRRRGDVVVWCLYPERVQKVRVKTRVPVGDMEGKIMDEVAEVKKRVERVEGKVEKKLTVEKPFWKQDPLIGDDAVRMKKRWKVEEWWDALLRRVGVRKEKKRWWEGWI